MFLTGKCPKCETRPVALNIEQIKLNEGVGQAHWNGATIICPSCKTILGAGFDMTALRDDIVDRICKRLKAGH
jgi:hypothetical protein